MIFSQWSVVSSQWSVVSFVFSHEKRFRVARSNFEKLDVYRLAENLADEVWWVALERVPLARDTVG